MAGNGGIEAPDGGGLVGEPATAAMPQPRIVWIRPFASSPMTRRSLARRGMKTRMIGRSIPFAICDTTMSGISEMRGISTTPPRAGNVTRPMNTGASRKFLLMPDSQPNASQIAYEVESGMTISAEQRRAEQADAEEKSGEFAGERHERRAAASADVAEIPAGWRTAPATTRMKNAKRPASVAPRSTSRRAEPHDSRSMPLSTTEACR